MKLFLIYLAVVNLAAFALMGVDKRRAERGAWRIPERTLFLPAILGGSPGAILGMQMFRHKTRHRQFAVGIPLILLVQLVIVVLLIWKCRGLFR